MKSLARLLMLSSLAWGAVAHAGPIEDSFRGFIDSLRASGKAQALGLGGPVGAPEITKPELAKRTDTLPLGENRYAMFVADGCRSCPAAVEQMRKQTKGSVEVLNISRSATAREAFQLTKAKGVPAVLMEGYVMSGYSKKMFERALIQGINDKALQQRGSGN